MGIQKDAGEILQFIYEHKSKGEEIPSTNEIKSETNWDQDRINNAIQYLVDKRLVYGQVVKTMGSTKPAFVYANDITPEGVDIMEDEVKFTKNFNFTVNLGVFSYSWGATER